MTKMSEQKFQKSCDSWKNRLSGYDYFLYEGELHVYVQIWGATTGISFLDLVTYWNEFKKLVHVEESEFCSFLFFKGLVEDPIERIGGSPLYEPLSYGEQKFPTYEQYERRWNLEYRNN